MKKWYMVPYLIMRIAIAMLNQLEWMGPQFGSINLLTGQVNIPSGTFDASLVLGVIGIDKIEWKALAGSISIWGGLFIAVTVKGLSVYSSLRNVSMEDLTPGRRRVAPHSQPSSPNKMGELLSWFIGTFLSISISLNDFTFLLHADHESASRDGEVILQCQQLQGSIKSLTNGSINVTNMSLSLTHDLPEQDGDEEDEDDPQPAFSLSSLECAVARGTNGPWLESISIAVGDVLLLASPSQSDALVQSVARLCRCLSPSVAMMKTHFRSSMYAFLDKVDASTAATTCLSKLSDDGYIYYDAAYDPIVPSKPPVPRLSLTVGRVSLDHSLIPSRPSVLALVQFNLNVCEEMGSLKVSLTVGDLLQTGYSESLPGSSGCGQIRSCRVDGEEVFLPPDSTVKSTEKWLALQYCSAVQVSFTGVLQRTRLCVEVQEVFALLALSKELTHVVAPAQAARSVLASGYNNHSYRRIGVNGSDSVGLRASQPEGLSNLLSAATMEAGCSLFRIDVLSRKLALLETHPLLSICITDLRIYAAEPYQPLSCVSRSVLLASDRSVAVRLEGVAATISRAFIRPQAFQWPKGSNRMFHRLLSTAVVSDWMDGAVGSRSSGAQNAVSVESTNVHILGTDLENLGYLQGLLQELGTVGVLGEFSPVAPLAMRQIAIPAVAAPRTWALTLSQLDATLSCSYLNPTTAEERSVHIELRTEREVEQELSDSAMPGTARSLPLLRYQRDSLGLGLAARSQLFLNHRLALHCTVTSHRNDSSSASSSQSKSSSDSSHSAVLLSVSPLATPLLQCLFFPRELFIAQNSSRAINHALGYMSTHTYVAIRSSAMDLDAHSVSPITHLLSKRAAAAQLGRLDAKELFTVLPVVLYHVAPSQGEAASSASIGSVPAAGPWRLLQPSSVLSVDLQSLEFKMSHEHSNVFVLSTAETEVHVIKFQGHLSQICGSITSLRVSENTMESAIHRNIIYDLDLKDPSIVDFHFSHLRGECPLIETRLDHVRALYNQRSIMTLVTFLRDHYLPSVNQASIMNSQLVPQYFLCEFGFGNNMLARRIVAMMKANRDSKILGVSAGANPAVSPQPRGMLRFTVSIGQSELHLPTNSCGNDSLVAVLANALIFKNDPHIHSQDPTYCPGPFISRGVWLAELENAHKTMKALKPKIACREAVHDLLEQYRQRLDADHSAMEEVVVWNLPQMAHTLTAPSSITERGAKEFNLDIEVTDSLIASWCNQNAVGENLNIFVAVNFRPALPASDGMYAEVLHAQGIKLAPSAVRNTVKVEVRSDYIEGTLAQGQYMAIVNLIQQNFSEVQVIVPDLFVLPKLKTVNLGEGIYGKQSLETRLPIISTVPLHIRSGKLTAIENTTDYYDLVGRVATVQGRKGAGESTGSSSGIGLDLNDSKREHAVKDRTVDSVPVWGHHHGHRNRLFARLPLGMRLRNQGQLKRSAYSRSAMNGHRGDDKIDSNTSSFPSSGIPFSAREADYSSGDAIMCIQFVGLEVDFYRYHYGGGNGIFCSAHTLVITAQHESVKEEDDRDDEEEEASPFGSMEHFTKHVRECSDHIVFAPKKVMSNGLSYVSRVDKDSNDDNDQYADTEVVPHIVYRQQGNGNLRRCVIEISESIAVAHVLTITAAMRYFVEPLHLTSTRNLAMIEKCGPGPLDFKAALDVELHARSTVFCLPNMAVNGKSKSREVSSGLCLHGDFAYLQAWRGFLAVGPGKITQIFRLQISSIFIAPLHEISVSGAESLVDPCNVQLTTEFMVAPDEANAGRNVALIAPWISLDPAWSEKKNVTGDASKPAGVRIIALEISKAVGNGNSAVDLETAEDGYAEGAEWATLEEKVEREERSIERSAIQLRVSLKDMILVHSAISQLNDAIANIPTRPPLSERFQIRYSTWMDIDHVPMLTHYLVHTPMTERWVMRNNDVVADICNFRAVLRNNTYNIRVAKINLTNIRLSYNHSMDHLHMAAGLSLSVWTHNEVVDKWEPVVETVGITAIGATDASMKDSPGSTQRTRIDVFCEPLEINASEVAINGLIRKLHLADVVTTSSAQLPPYLIRNDLGVPVTIDIGIDGVKAISEQIDQGAELPVEARKLSMAAARYHRIGPGATEKGAIEHLLNIRFSVGVESYQSNVPVPIDREGLLPMEMRPASAARRATVDRDKSLQDTVPYAMVNMIIKEDGGREIILRSVLSLRNQTNRTMQVSVRLYGLMACTSLGPGAEWNVPVSLAFPQASIFMRFDDRSDWFEALHTLKSMVLHGSWNRPTKLAAELCSCPMEKAILADAWESSWMLLLKPEMIDSSGGAKTLIPVKYPVKEKIFAALHKQQMHMEGGVDTLAASAMLDELKAYTKQQFSLSSSESKRARMQSVCIQLIAPLQVCNMVCQPIAYRLADSEGFVSAEGLILPGEVIDVHSLSQLFHNKIYISLRMLNYCWSKWVKIFTRSSPYPSSEKIVEATLQSLDFCYQGEHLTIPAIDITISLREHFIRLSCPLIISNRTGLQLDFCESSNPDNYVPQSSQRGADQLVCSNPAFMGKDGDIDQLNKKKQTARVIGRSGSALGSAVAMGGQADEDESDTDDSIGRGFEVESLSGDDSPKKERASENSPDDFFDSSTPSSKVKSGLPLPLTRASARSSLLAPVMPAQRKRIVNLIVHLPSDHLRKVEVAAHPSWTLADVFARIASKVASDPDNSRQDLYQFYEWEEGKQGARKIEHSPAAEADVFARMAGSFMAGSSSDAGTSGASENKLTPLSSESLRALAAEQGGRDRAESEFARGRAPSVSSETSEAPSVTASRRLLSGPSSLSRSFSSSLSNMARRMTSSNLMNSSPSTDSERVEKVPPNMMFNMLADCSIPLSMDSRVEDLVQRGVGRIRVACTAECAIYEQAAGILTEVIKKDGVMGSVFGRLKSVHRATYQKVDGDLPFNPHRLLGLAPSLSLRVPYQTEWSEALDLRDGNLGLGQVHLAVGSQIPAADRAGGPSVGLQHEGHFEFGAFVERGKGFYQNVTSVSIVAKHLIISELSICLQLRQIGVDEPFKLSPGSVQSFHYPSKSQPKLLQIRRLYSSFSDDDSGRSDEDDGDIGATPLGSCRPMFSGTFDKNSDNVVSDWSGEIDISTLGIVYAKLRNPLLILQIRIEMVGASLVATLSEQSATWPPYRLDNLTSLDCRFKQFSYVPTSIVNTATIQSVTGVTMSGGGTSSHLNTSKKTRRSTSAIDSKDTEDVFKKMLESYVPQPTESTLHTPFDHLPSRSSCSFAWDYPKTGDKVLRIEFAQGPTLWEPVDVQLDEVGTKPKTVTLRRSLPSLGNPLAEGYLQHQENKDDSWLKVYCILKTDVFFMFQDDTRSDLIGIINMSRPSQSGGELLLAEAVKYVTQEWDMYSTINQNIFGGQDNGRAARLNAERQVLDPNKARVLLLQIAEVLGLLTNMPASAAELHSSSSVRRASSADGEDEVLSSPGSVRETASELLAASSQPEVPPDNLPEDFLPAPIHSLTLKEAFMRGLTVDNIFDHLGWTHSDSHSRDHRHSKQSLRMCDIIWALLDLGVAGDDEEARSIFDLFCTQGIFFVSARDADRDMRDSSGADSSQTDLPAATDSSIAGGVVSMASEIILSLHDRLQAQSLNQADDAVGVKLRARQRTRSRIMASEWCIRAPLLQRELEKELREGSLQHPDSSLNDTYSFLRPGGTMEAAKEVGFTLILGEGRHNFKCDSGGEFHGWIQNCRRSIEMSWVDHLRGGEQRSLEGQGQMTMDSFLVQVMLKVRADGPTKVLEVTESDSRAGKRDMDAVKASSEKEKSELKSDGKGDGEKNSETVQPALGALDSDQAPNAVRLSSSPLVTVSMVLQSVALSVIDTEPCEVLYLQLKDIEMSIERSRASVKMAATVQQIQVSNQLLHPMFPVALFPRPIRPSDKGGGVSRLMLPGLHQRGDSYPTLHLFFQQKYHQNVKEDHTRPVLRNRKGRRGRRNGKSSNSKSGQGAEQNLLYFDMATLWVAPMVLDIDEETMVRAVRMLQNIRSAITRPDLSSNAAITEEILAQQHIGTRSWGAVSASSLAKGYKSFLHAGKLPYSLYDPSAQVSRGIYFSLLQLHPLDIKMSFRSSPDFHCTTSELGYVSLVAQLDSARLCLNALICEHAYGSISIILDILSKHYQASLWRQLHRLVGSTDFVEGSVGLVANLGTGVYDLFYEPIDGLLDENSTFLSGLSKGGRSLASRTIGGTSAQVSKLASGLGKGVSMLTLDAEFQRSRTSRRMKKTHSMSEGFYVGTRELGRSIIDGLTGVVASPYQGWKEDGTAGAVQGLGKGIIGLALKPAVGVFDLASRATEGIRNTAFGSEAGERDGIHRSRVPRAFGRSNLLLPFALLEAAAQFLADKVTKFSREGRMRIVYHQRFHRRVGAIATRASTAGPTSPTPSPSKPSNMHASALAVPTQGEDDYSSTIPLDSPHRESWGMAGGGSYVALVSTQGVALAQCRSHRGSPSPDLRLIWTCPAGCIDELKSDARGDLVLRVSRAVSVDSEISPHFPATIDVHSQNYIIMQALLEQTVGVKAARKQSLTPRTGLVERDILKRYSNGFKSVLLSPTRHTFQLVGCVLYEYTLLGNGKQSTTGGNIHAPAVGAPSRVSFSLADAEREVHGAVRDVENPLSDRTQSGAGVNPHRGLGRISEGFERFSDSADSTSEVGPVQRSGASQKDIDDVYAQSGARESTSSAIAGYDNDRLSTGAQSASPAKAVVPADNVTRLVADLFAKDPVSESHTVRPLPAGTLSYLYPLVDSVVTGPVEEKALSTGIVQYAVNLARKDAKSMRVLKRDGPEEQLSEHHKSMLTLIFPRRDTAVAWKAAIEGAIIRSPVDVLQQAPVSNADAKKKLSVRQMVERAGKQADEFLPEEAAENSIFGSLVIPTSGSNQHGTEALKIEIAKTLSQARR